MPSFPGGEEAMMKYMLSKVKYSELERERGVTGTMYISFVVHTGNNITQIILARKTQYGEKISNKAIKTISEMPKWNPGMNGKVPVAVRYTMPVSFKLKN